MNNYKERLVNALIKFYEGAIEAHIMNIEVLLGSHVGLRVIRNQYLYHISNRIHL